jgi:hypothetical protein
MIIALRMSEVVEGLDDFLSSARRVRRLSCDPCGELELFLYEV